MIRRGAKLLKVLPPLLMGFVAGDAVASDVAMGRLLAASHCAVCHVVAPGRPEVADAPSFETIALKYNFNPEVIAIVILGPHVKMNFMPQRADAVDIATYIATLPR